MGQLWGSMSAQRQMLLLWLVLAGAWLLGLRGRGGTAAWGGNDTAGSKAPPHLAEVPK